MPSTEDSAVSVTVMKKRFLGFFFILFNYARLSKKKEESESL